MTVRASTGPNGDRPRVALICGAASGIGRAAARRFAREGLAVVLCDADAGPLHEALAELRDAGGLGDAVQADLAIETQVRAAVHTAVDSYGRLDVLVNAAGIDGARPWEETDFADWDAHLRANLTSVFLCCRAVTPHMRPRRYGKIVNVASSAGRYRSSYTRYGATVAAGVPYASSHGGILALTRQLAFELADAGIYVNAVVPGFILTPRLKDEWSRLPEQVRDDILAETALGRLGDPEEVAAVINFLASDASSYVTGAALDVNGGWWMS
jgi:NAD(P)-dependent dehydrogenase (short-subunit alcohol dehydrogenase family)